MNVTVLDYGAGNLHSLIKALEAGGAAVTVADCGAMDLALDAWDSPGADGALRAGACSTDALVLPGVGAFGPASSALRPYTAQLRSRLSAGLPCLGICLGMQLLFDGSEEGAGDGLGVIGGQVRRLRSARVPHIGWNRVVGAEDDLLLGTASPFYAYYANSFVAEPSDAADVTAWTEYEGERFPAAVRRGRTWGVQFHPEKSGRDGLRIIRSFLAQVLP